MALSMAAVLLIAYKSFDVSNICVEKASTLVVEQSNKFRGTEPEEESTQPEPRPLAAVTPAASPAPKQSMIDQRSLLGNVTLTGRTGI